MKLLIKDGKIIGTADDSYTSPEQWVQAPEGFELENTGDYSYKDGVLTLRSESKLTKLQFRKRFTDAEKIAVYEAAVTSAALRVFIDDIQSAEFVDLEDVDVIAGVELLTENGLISETRAAEILHISEQIIDLTVDEYENEAVDDNEI